jgi:ABC-type branched-subunit amino acid transport system substrate-binding protein
MQRKRDVRLVLSVCLFVLVLVWAMPQQAAAGRPGFDDKEIRIGNFSPQTGVAAAWGGHGRCPNILYQMVNEQGGIHGRKIKYYVRDDQYNPVVAKAVVKELVEKIGILAVTGIVSSACGNAVKDYLAEHQVIICTAGTAGISPVLEANIKPGAPPNRYLFSFVPVYEDSASVLTQFIVKKLGMKKIGVLYQNDVFGQNGLKGVKQRLDAYGMKVLEQIPVEVSDKDLGSQLLRLKNAGVEAAILWLNPSQAVLAVKTAKGMKYQPQFFSFDGNSDYPLMYKISGGLWEGVITPAIYPMPQSNDPDLLKYREAAKKFAPEEPWGVVTISGITVAEPLVEALRRVGRDLSVEATIKALESFRNWKGLGPPITWSADRRQGAEAVQIQKCGPGGSFILLQDWTANDLCAWKNRK